MICNDNITIYHKLYNKETRLDEWIPTQVENVSWVEKQAVTVGEKGLYSADIFVVRIPFRNQSININNGDIVVKGLLYDIPDKISDITSTDNICFTVTGWAFNNRGSQLTQHWRISGK